MAKKENRRDTNGVDDPWSQVAVEKAQITAKLQAQETIASRKRKLEEASDRIQEAKGESFSVYGVVGHITGQGARMYYLYQEQLKDELRYFYIVTDKQGQEVVHSVDIEETRAKVGWKIWTVDEYTNLGSKD